MLQTLPAAHSGLSQINWRLFWSPQQRLLFLYMRPSGPGAQTRNWTLGTLAFSFFPPPPFHPKVTPSSLSSLLSLFIVLHYTFPISLFSLHKPKTTKNLFLQNPLLFIYFTPFVCVQFPYTVTIVTFPFISHFPHFFHFARWANFLHCQICYIILSRSL